MDLINSRVAVEDSALKFPSNQTIFDNGVEVSVAVTHISGFIEVNVRCGKQKWSTFAVNTVGRVEVFNAGIDRVVVCLKSRNSSLPSPYSEPHTTGF